jgi:hypothetical protein
MNEQSIVKAGELGPAREAIEGDIIDGYIVIKVKLTKVDRETGQVSYAVVYGRRAVDSPHTVIDFGKADFDGTLRAGDTLNIEIPYGDTTTFADR